MERRDFLRLGAVAGISIFGLAACGNDNSGPTIDGEARTIQDIDGNDVEIPANPSRIVSLSEPTLDSLLALGITPIGAVTGRGQSTFSPYLGDRTANIPVLGGVAQPNFEAIGAANPDLILVDGTSINNNPPVIEALSKIAPLVYTGYAGGDWRLNFRIVANAVNKAAEGEKLEAEYNQRVADMKAQLAPQYGDKTFSIVRWEGGSASMILKELPAGIALSDLGLKRPPNQDRNGRGHSEPVSAENLQQIDGDYMFFGTLGGSSISNPNAGGSADEAAAEQALAQAEAAPGFTELKAYKEDHIITADGSSWTSTGGPILMNGILDDVQSNLLG